jgi:hypothetical protein
VLASSPFIPLHQQYRLSPLTITDYGIVSTYIGLDILRGLFYKMYSPPILRPAACEICQDLPKGYSPKDFKDTHGFSKDWQLQAESEEERYGTVETHNEHLRKEYLEMAARNRLCRRPEFQAVMSRREKEPLLRNLARINQYEQFQKVANTQQRGRSTDDGTDSSHTTMPVKMCVNIFEETNVIIRVCEARFVRGGRWYLP